MECKEQKSEREFGRIRRAKRLMKEKIIKGKETIKSKEWEKRRWIRRA